MLDVLDDFYRGLGSRYALESALEEWTQTVEEYETRDVYEGDSYYQEALATKSALEEALNQFDTYYDENETYIYQE